MCNESALVAADLKSSLLSSGTYMPGKTSPQVLHFSISIGISLLLVVHGMYYRYAPANKMSTIDTEYE
jgi:hypothetical protein